MKTVLWISRHHMTTEQMEDLERVVGDKVELIQWDHTITDVEEIKPILEIVDAVAAVLPPETMSRLLPLMGHVPLLRGVSERRRKGVTQDENAETQYEYVHLCWERVLKCEYVTRRL